MSIDVLITDQLASNVVLAGLATSIDRVLTSVTAESLHGYAFNPVLRQYEESTIVFKTFDQDGNQYEFSYMRVDMLYI